MNRKKIIRNAAFISLLLLVAGGFYAYKEYNRKNESLESAKPEFTKTATEIINEFTTNEKQANATYLGKVVLLHGPVKSVESDDQGHYTISLGDPTSGASIRCSLDSTETQTASSLQSASLISVKGICTGFIADEMGLGADVIFNRCVIIKK
jgi:hypothetical protein